MKPAHLLALAAVLTVSAAADAGVAPTIPLNYGHTGTWYQPETVGQGMLIEVVPASSMLVLSWFTYAGAQDSPAVPQGSSEPRWYFAQGAFLAGDHSVQVTILRPQGGRLAISGASDFPIVGSAQLSFDSCDSGLLSYQFNESGASGEIPLTRLFADGICAQFLSPPEARK